MERFFSFPSDTCCPLLLHLTKRIGNSWHYYSPLHNKTFTVCCPLGDLSGVRFLATKDGWLLLTRWGSDMLLLNPFSGTSYQLTSLEESSVFDRFAFSSRPPITSPDFMILRLGSRYEDCVRISLFRCGEWSSYNDYYFDEDFIACTSNPVFHRGLFYCLGTTGNLGIYDPNKDTWSILSKSEPLSISNNTELGLLAESDRELLAFSIGDRCVYRLNQAEGTVTWQPMHTLADRTVFAGYPTSLLMTSPPKGMENNIYTNKFRGRPEIVPAQVTCSERQVSFVSQQGAAEDAEVDRNNKDIICHTLGSQGISVEEWQENVGDAIQFLYSIWIEPRFDD